MLGIEKSGSVGISKGFLSVPSISDSWNRTVHLVVKDNAASRNHDVGAEEEVDGSGKGDRHSRCVDRGYLRCAMPWQVSIIIVSHGNKRNLRVMIFKTIRVIRRDILRLAVQNLLTNRGSIAII